MPRKGPSEEDLAKIDALTDAEIAEAFEARRVWRYIDTEEEYETLMNNGARLSELGVDYRLDDAGDILVPADER